MLHAGAIALAKRVCGGQIAVGTAHGAALQALGNFGCLLVRSQDARAFALGVSASRADTTPKIEEGITAIRIDQACVELAAIVHTGFVASGAFDAWFGWRPLTQLFLRSIGQLGRLDAEDVVASHDGLGNEQHASADDERANPKPAEHV